MKRLGWLFACILVCLVAAGCSDEEGTAPGTQNDRLGWGEACEIPLDCREGLTCIDNECKPSPDAAEGEACELSGECQEGLKCDPATRMCVAAGDAAEGDQCGSTPDCQRGLVCVAEGFTGKCQPGGSTDVGEECSALTDCVAGLSCNPDPSGSETSCQAAPPTIPEPFLGVDCADSAESGATAFFELPDSETVEFYRLPFPNDIRIEDGSPDMSGHPTPGDGVLGFDIVQRYLDAISADQDRYGLGQTVYFRFSNRIDFASIEGRGENATLSFVNIDAESDEYNRGLGMSWQYSSGRQKYICQNWLAVRPQDASPLLRETTYAVILRTGVTDTDGNPVERDEDFGAMLQDSEPEQARLIEPWQRYQPLRDWAADQGVDPSTILSAAVFTTGDPWALSSKLRDAARSATPEISDVTLCEQGTTSPCDDGLEGDAHVRGCFDVHPDFHEIHGRIDLPVFQDGDAPYLNEGGDIATSAGEPVSQRDDSVCTAITVPKSVSMPADGWPLLIYAHGTGGTYRNHVSNVSPMVSKMTIDGTDTGMLVMGWDQVQHFNRRGDSEAHPNELVFNYPNPDASLGNFLQGAADIHAVVAWAENFSLPAGESPTGEEIRVDPDAIYFMGHSQGGTTGPLALPFDQTIKGSVLSGAGADIRRSLRHKTSPADVRTGFMVAVQDFQSLQGDGDVGINHPILSLLSGYFAPVDPLNYGRFIAARQTDGTSPGHVLHIYGEGDTFTPPQAIEMLAYAMRIPYIGPVEFLQGTPDERPLPVSGNLDVSGASYTGVGRQYEPDDYDGHFVSFRNVEAMDDIVEFFGSALVAEDGVPTIAD